MSVQTARQRAQHLGRTSWFAQSFGGCRCTAQCSGSHPALSAHPAACGHAFSKICITASLDLVHAAKCRAVPPPLFRTLAASGYACIRLRTLLLDLARKESAPRVVRWSECGWYYRTWCRWVTVDLVWMDRRARKLTLQGCCGCGMRDSGDPESAARKPRGSEGARPRW